MCFSCQLLEPMNHSAEQFAIRVFEALAPGALLLFQAFIAVWLIIVIFKLLMGNITLAEVVYPAFTFTFITLILQGHHFFWEYVYTPLYQTTLQLLSTIIGALQIQTPVQTLSDLLGVVESSLWKVIQFSGRVQQSSGWLDVTPLLVGFVLMIPYIFLLALFMVFTIEFLLKLCIVSALSPLFIVALAFKSFRGYPVAALKVMLQGILTLAISVMCMGLTLNAIHHATAVLNLPEGGSLELTTLGEFSMRLCALFALGVVAVIFQQKVPAIASTILGVEDGAGFFGMTTQATSGAIKGTARLGGKILNKIGGFIGDRFQ